MCTYIIINSYLVISVFLKYAIIKKKSLRLNAIAYFKKISMPKI